MKKLIITVLGVIGGSLLVVLCIHLLHSDLRRDAVPHFSRYEADTNGVVRAFITVTNPCSSCVLVVPQDVPSVSTRYWKDSIVSLSPHESTELGLVVMSSSRPWQLRLSYWKVKTIPDWSESKRVVAGKPDFTGESSVSQRLP